MRSVVLSLLFLNVLSCFAEHAAAQSQFPYQAIIVDDEVYSRSGPGRQYYPTSRFRKGDRVTVVRHDPGGWFMIDPPPGSFDWVRKEFIRREGDHGIVIADGTIVAWMGTNFGDDHYVEKRRLQKGERVEILGEKVLHDQRGPGEVIDVPYYKIQPPSGDFRWVAGAKVMPADKQQAALQSRNPGVSTAGDRIRDPNVSPVDLSQLGSSSGSTADLAQNEKRVPAPRDFSETRGPTSGDFEDESKGAPFARSKADDNTKLPFETGEFPEAKFGEKKVADTAKKPNSAAWDRIHAIDDDLQTMLRRDSREWDFTAIETELQELSENDETSGAARNRLAMLARQKRIKTDHDELDRIMAETNRRDSDLAINAKEPIAITPPPPRAGTQSTARPAVSPPPGATTTQPNRVPGQPVRTQPLPGATGTRQGVNTLPPATGANPATTQASSSTAKPQFAGAGIIQRSTSGAPGAPKYVLMHPNGRVLAYLKAEPGVNLDNYIGEQMGLEGTRAFRPELNGDLLTVRKLHPVKLKP